MIYKTLSFVDRHNALEQQALANLRSNVWATKGALNINTLPILEKIRMVMGCERRLDDHWMILANLGDLL